MSRSRAGTAETNILGEKSTSSASSPCDSNRGCEAQQEPLPRSDLDPEDEQPYPEGGFRAWAVVFGSFCGMLAGFGMMNTVGTFQAYLSTHQLSNYSEGNIGWIFSLYVFLSFFCGILIGPIFDAKGPNLLVFLGSISLLASMMLLGLCTSSSLLSTYSHPSLLSLFDRVLAFHRRLWHPRRLGNVFGLYTRRVLHRPFLPEAPCKCYRLSNYRRKYRRHHVSSDASVIFSETGVCLEHEDHGIHNAFSTYHCQCPYPL